MHINPENIAELLMAVAIFIKQWIDSHNRKKNNQAAIDRTNEIKGAITAAVLEIQKWADDRFVQILPFRQRDNQKG